MDALSAEEQWKPSVILQPSPYLCFGFLCCFSSSGQYVAFDLDMNMLDSS